MSKRPNVIFIVADDLGCYGGRVAAFGRVSPVPVPPARRGRGSDQQQE
jgi:hypothetical protein